MRFDGLPHKCSKTVCLCKLLTTKTLRQSYYIRKLTLRRIRYSITHTIVSNQSQLWICMI